MDRQIFMAEMSEAKKSNIDYIDGVIYDSIKSADKLNPSRLSGHYNLDICKEECAELIQELSKVTRNKGNYFDLLQELADVAICIRYVQKICNINDDDLNKAITVKISRVEDNLKQHGVHQ